jgi:hypothetical protein
VFPVQVLKVLLALAQLTRRRASMHSTTRRLLGKVVSLMRSLAQY